MAIAGGIGLFLAMPGGRRAMAGIGYLLLAGAAALLIALVLPAVGAGGRAVWLAILGLIGLWGAVRVITHSRPVYSALYFILVVVATSGLLLLAEAEFLAAAVIIIYAGAILVTYVFVIMLAQQAGPPAVYDRQAREPFLGVLTGFVLLGALSAHMIGTSPEPAPESSIATTGTVATVGGQMLTTYIIGVEIVGLILLAAMVGAIAIARRRPVPQELEGDWSC